MFTLLSADLFTMPHRLEGNKMLRPRRTAPTETGRSESFSDGVFAVAITLLALDLSRIHANPKVGDGTFFAAFEQLWPSLLAFASSFAFIGIAWTNHHYIFVRVKQLSRGLNGANLLLLAAITLVPWANSTLADSLSLTGKHGQQEVVLYSAVTLLGTSTWWLIFHTLSRHPELLEDPELAKGFAADRIRTLVGAMGSIIPGVIGFFWSPIIAVMMFFAVLVFFAVTSAGFERT